jgi:hypothetical protein
MPASEWHIDDTNVRPSWLGRLSAGLLFIGLIVLGLLAWLAAIGIGAGVILSLGLSAWWRRRRPERRRSGAVVLDGEFRKLDD